MIEASAGCQYRWLTSVRDVHGERLMATHPIARRRWTLAEWLVFLWFRVLGRGQSIHAVMAYEPPVVVGQTYLRPGVWWPRVVTMRYVAAHRGAQSDWYARRPIAVPAIVGASRLVAWRERRAGLFEGLRVHAKMRLP